MGNGAITEKRHQNLFADLLRVALIGLLFGGVALLVKYGGTGPNLSWIRSLLTRYASDPNIVHQLEAILGFIGFSGILISLGVPRLWISAVAGAIYGAAFGALWALAGTIIGAAGIYWLGRTLLGDLVRRRMGGKLAVWNDRLRANAFWWVLYARLLPFANSTLTGLLFGSCRVPFRKYMLASILGFIPLTLVLSSFGSGGFQGSLFQIAIGFAILGATIFFRKWLMRSCSLDTEIN